MRGTRVHLLKVQDKFVYQGFGLGSRSSKNSMHAGDSPLSKRQSCSSFCCFTVYDINSGRSLSSSRSRSRSSSSRSHASLSSLSSSGHSEHLYRDIASDISSASSAPASPVQTPAVKQKTRESWLIVTLCKTLFFIPPLLAKCYRIVLF